VTTRAGAFSHRRRSQDSLGHIAERDETGYRSLNDGKDARFDWEPFLPGQDGYLYRTTSIVRLNQ
jgi:hypothetical protein